MKSYILNKRKFLKTGSVEATMTSPDGIEPKYVDYSSYLNEELGRNLTLEEYIEVKKDKDLEVVDTFEMEKLYNQYQKSLTSNFVEITEDRWYEMLEVLPPMKWHDYKGINIFFISEATSGSMHSCFIKTHDKKYYESLQDIFSKDEVIYENFEKSIKLFKND